MLRLHCVNIRQFASIHHDSIRLLFLLRIFFSVLVCYIRRYDGNGKESPEEKMDFPITNGRYVLLTHSRSQPERGPHSQPKGLIHSKRASLTARGLRSQPERGPPSQPECLAHSNRASLTARGLRSQPEGLAHSQR